MRRVWLISALLLSVLVLLTSLQSGQASGELSGSITEFVHRMLTGLFPGWGLNPEDLHWLIRKAAHVTSHFVLGVVWANTFRLYGKPIPRSLYVGIGLSVLGETLQMFAEDRGPSLVDALAFNAVGFALGVLALAFFLRQSARNKQNVS